MPDSFITITTTGTATANVDTWQLGAGGTGDHHQITREARATAITLNDWTISATASTGQIAADTSRIGMLIAVRSDATARVFFRFDTTAPTTGSFGWFLDPGTEWEVPQFLSQQPVSMYCTVAAGHVLSTLGTNA